MNCRTPWSTVDILQVSCRYLFYLVWMLKINYSRLKKRDKQTWCVFFFGKPHLFIYFLIYFVINFRFALPLCRNVVSCRRKMLQIFIPLFISDIQDFYFVNVLLFSSMFNGVCLSEIAMEKIMWERHISKLCLKFLKIQTVPGFLLIFKSFQRQKALMLGCLSFK